MVPAGPPSRESPRSPTLPPWTSGSQDDGPRWRPHRAGWASERPGPWSPTAWTSPSAAATPTAWPQAVAELAGARRRGRARPGRRRQHGGGGRRRSSRDATRGARAASTSSCPTPAGPPAAASPTPTCPPTRPALELSLLSTVAMCQAAVPAMREQRWGRVVAITSVSVRQPIPGLILSNTARAGRHRLPQDARPRGGGRRRHGELRAARLPRHRPPPLASTAATSPPRPPRSPPASSAAPRTSAPSSRSSAPTRPASSPAPPSPSTAAPTEPSSDRRLWSIYVRMPDVTRHRRRVSGSRLGLGR